MRPRAITYTNIQDDSTNFFVLTGQTHAAGVALTQTATATTDLLAHLVIITPAGSVSGNYALVGTDADGAAQTETVNTDTVNAVTSTKYFKTLTSVTPSFTDSDSVIVGITDDAVSPTIGIDWCSPYAAAIQVDTNSANVNWSIQEIAQNIYASTVSPAQLTPWFSITALASKTADTAGTATVGMSAIRFLMNSAGDATTDIIVYVSQPTRGD